VAVAYSEIEFLMLLDQTSQLVYAEFLWLRVQEFPLSWERSHIRSHTSWKILDLAQEQHKKRMLGCEGSYK
jgi:hypothetical protein